MGSFYMEATQINYRRDDTFKTVDQKLQELSETSAIDTDIAPVFKSTNTYAPGDMVYYRSKLYTFNVEHSGAWAAGDVTATDVTTEISSLRRGLTNYEATTNAALSVPEDSGKNLFSGSFTTTTNGGVTFTANSDGTVSATNTSTGYASVNSTEFTLKKGQYIFSGVPSGNAKYVLALYANNVVLSQIANGSSVTINLDSDTALVMRCVINGSDVETGVDFEPMIRPASITDATFAPYIPSVESRIEAVESGMTGVAGVVNVSTQNIKLFNTTDNNIIAELHATTDATEIVNDKYNNGAVVNSIRLYLDVNNKCIKAAYFNGTSWDRRTILDFTSTP